MIVSRALVKETHTHMTPWAAPLNYRRMKSFLLHLEKTLSDRFTAPRSNLGVQHTAIRPNMDGQLVQ